MLGTMLKRGKSLHAKCLSIGSWVLFIGSCFVVLALRHAKTSMVVTQGTPTFSSQLKEKYQRDPKRQLAPMECSNKLRMERIAKVCKHNNWKEGIFDGNETNRLLNLMASDYHKVIYCYLPKVGCTTFKYLLAKEDQPDIQDIDDVEADGQPRVHSLEFLGNHSVVPLIKYTVEEAQCRLENYHKLIVVRHPFSRLLSAYNNKIYPKGWYVDKYAEVINEYFEDNTVLERGLSIAQFIELLVERTEQFHNPHWTSYYEQCFPCDIQYQQILKLETIQTEFPSLLYHIFGSASNIDHLPNLNHVPMAKTGQNDTDAIFINQSEALISGLVKTYQKDFDLFGYDWSPTDGSVCGDKFGCGPGVSCI